MTWPHACTTPTSRVHLVGATRFPRHVTPVVEKSALLALLAVTSAVVALRFHMPVAIRLVALVVVVGFLIIADAVPSMSRGVALTTCVLAGLGATWLDPHRGVSSSIDIVLSGVGTGAVLLSAQQIQRRQLPPIVSSVLVGLATSFLYDATLNRAAGSLSYSDATLLGFVEVAAMIAVATMLLVAIFVSTHRPRIVHRNAPDENAHGWLLALRATLVLVFVFLVFSGLIL